MTRSLAGLAALFFLSAAPTVLCPSSASAQTTAAQEGLDTEARSLFEAGRTAYGNARYQDALGHFQRSYELSQRPQLLYNIGQCQDRLRHDAEAIAAFEGFIAALPDAPQRPEVEARLVILRASIRPAGTDTAATEAAVTPDVTPAPTVTNETTETPDTTPVVSSGSDPAPWIVLGVGGAVAIVGAIVLGVGYANIATVEDARNVPFSSVSGAYHDAPVLTGVGWSALGVGVALAGVGLVWGLSGSSSSSEHAQLHLGPTGLAVSGSF